jgi:hypothetical protein
MRENGGERRVDTPRLPSYSQSGQPNYRSMKMSEALSKTEHIALAIYAKIADPNEKDVEKHLRLYWKIQDVMIKTQRQAERQTQQNK